MKRMITRLVVATALAMTSHGVSSRNTVDFSSLPREITTSPQGPDHVQGVAVDTENGYIYFSFTSSLVKTDMEGRVVGSVTGFHGAHLGCITFNPDDGCIYGSCEYKNDEIGSSLRRQEGVKVDTSEGAEASTGYYIAMFEGDKITRPNLDAEADGMMKLTFVREAYDDFFAKVSNGGHTADHRYGCSGIDGTAVGPEIGGRNKHKYIYTAYGVYGDTTRTDNDHQVICGYRLDRIRKHATPFRRGVMHRNGPKKPDSKLFVMTGNTHYGVQNLNYDPSTSRYYLAVYKGRKSEYPNYDLFAIDASGKPVRSNLKGVEPRQKGEVVPLSGAWHFPYGACGFCSLGDGYYYIAEKLHDKGQQYCRLRLYRATEGAVPFRLAE